MKLIMLVLCLRWVSIADVGGVRWRRATQEKCRLSIAGETPIDPDKLFGRGDAFSKKECGCKSPKACE